jgi:hypothetical protein
LKAVAAANPKQTFFATCGQRMDRRIRLAIKDIENPAVVKPIALEEDESKRKHDMQVRLIKSQQETQRRKTHVEYQYEMLKSKLEMEDLAMHGYRPKFTPISQQRHTS